MQEEEDLNRDKPLIVHLKDDLDICGAIKDVCFLGG